MDEALARAGWEPSPVPAAVVHMVDDQHDEPAPPPMDEEELLELVELAVGNAPRRLLSRFREIARTDSLTIEDVLFDRVRPVANRLGDCWLEDSLSFGEVTVGADALQRVVAAFGYEAEGPLQHRELVVLTAAPGEQHVLPIHVLSEAIRADGWSTHVDAQMELEDLVDLVSAEEVAMVGVTCKDPRRLQALEGFAETIREASIAPVELALGGSAELEPYAQAIGFTYYSSGRGICRRLALGGAL